MDIVLLFNGLGNQMSQYAFSLSKEQYNSRCLVAFDPASENIHNGYELEKIFGIKLPKTFTSRTAFVLYRICHRFKLHKLANSCAFSIIREPLSYTYNKDYLKKGPAMLNVYWGGWHSEKYFKSLRPKLLDLFKFPFVANKTENDLQYNKLLRQITEEDNSVSIHVRRGDYLTEPEDSPYNYYICSEKYYLKSIQYLEERYCNLTFYVFSNDIAWCRNVFNGEDFTFVDFNTRSNSWRDMSLMSKCKHHIVANSTFSWWGAWLCQRQDGLTLRPPKFLTNIDTPDFFPENWIDIDPEEDE